MKTKFIEATDSTEFNWGKFLLARFEEEEWHRPSGLSSEVGSLLRSRGWDSHHLLVMDLQTGEGCIFRPRGHAGEDLRKHRVWVCPMFEPFLAWLYTQDLTDLDKLPAVVNLGRVPTAMRGYRRPGVKGFLEAYAALCQEYGLRLTYKKASWVVTALKEKFLERILEAKVDKTLRPEA